MILSFEALIFLSNIRCFLQFMAIWLRKDFNSEIKVVVGIILSVNFLPHLQPFVSLLKSGYGPEMHRAKKINKSNSNISNNAAI